MVLILFDKFTGGNILVAYINYQSVPHNLCCTDGGYLLALTRGRVIPPQIWTQNGANFCLYNGATQDKA
jgi:hypothetical protein